jgi:hypothetical protein
LVSLASFRLLQLAAPEQRPVRRRAVLGRPGDCPFIPPDEVKNEWLGGRKPKDDGISVPANQLFEGCIITGCGVPPEGDEVVHERDLVTPKGEGFCLPPADVFGRVELGHGVGVDRRQCLVPGDAPRSEWPAFPQAGPLAGRWVVNFANGVAEVCEIGQDGAASVAELRRTSGGKVTARDGAIVVAYDDDRVERWTPAGRKAVVEHWYPGSAFPSGAPVLGIARSVR